MTDTVYTPAELLAQLIERYPALSECRGSIDSAFEMMCGVFRSGGTLFTAGNGGSSADSDHITGELLKSFMFRRPADKALAGKLEELFGDDGKKVSSQLEGGLPAIPLSSLTAASTAVINDIGGEMIFAQTVSAAGRSGDCFLGISTSGNSKNIVYAAMAAKAKDMKTIALTGKKHCRLDDICDVVIHVTETETFKIQELHLPVYHALCAMIESEFFSAAE